MRKTCLALAIVLALPALLHAQEAEEPEKKEKRAQFIIHANYLPTLPNLEETTSFTRFLEQGSTSRVYSGGSGTAIEVGGMYALASRFSFGFSFELLPALQDGTLDVSEPHPLLFNQHLKASQTLDELDYSEFTVHTCAPQKVHPALIGRFRPAMVGCFWPIFSFADHIPRRVTLRPAIRVPRARKETPSKNGMPHSRAKTWI